MGLFSSKKKRVVSVGGGVSRLRTDESIRNSTGLVVASAITTNQDISEAILLNEFTGTKTSFKLFNRKAKKSSTIGLPTTNFTYTTINSEQVAAAVRASNGQSYPTSLLNQDIELTVLSSAVHVKYALQQNRSYNLTTNIFVENGNQYYFESSTDIIVPSNVTGPYNSEITYKPDLHTGYVVTGYKAKTTTTTTTTSYSFFTLTDPGPPLVVTNMVRQTITTQVVSTFLPSGTPTTVITSTTSDSVFNPADNYSTTVVVGAPVTTKESISFGLTVPRPVISYIQPVQDSESGAVTFQEVFLNHWIVYYTYNDRRYIWIGEADQVYFLEETTSINTTTNSKLLFSPIIAIKDNKVNLTDGSTAHKEVVRVLKTIQLDPDAIIEAIDNDPQSNDVEDVYISLLSNLVSDHMDQLAYNYAFFEYLDTFGITIPNGENTLSVVKSGTYRNDTSWSGITKTSHNGTLPQEYTATLTSINAGFGGIFSKFRETKNGIYTIRKRTSASTYDQIVVNGLATSYVVYASEGDVKAFSVDMDDSDDGASQIVIPFSYEIANTIPAKYRETLYLRCMHIGMFAKKVQIVKTKWYQRGIFAVILIVVVVIIAIVNPEFLIEVFNTIGMTGAAEAVAGGINVFAAYLIKSAIIQFALQTVFTEILQSTDNKFFRLLATVAYVAFAFTQGGGSFNNILSNVKAILHISSIAMSAFSTMVQANVLTDITKGYESLRASLDELEKVNEESEKIINEAAAQRGEQNKTEEYLQFINLFKKMGEEHISEQDLEENEYVASNSEQPDLISSFVAEALQLLTPDLLMIQSDRLQNS